MKKEVFAELERVVSPECVLATNTSSLSVTEMGAELEHPERVVGMHFFNPVAVLPLVELVRTPSTDDVTLAAWAVTRKLRRRASLVQDAPAFVVNRLLGRQGRVSCRRSTAGTRSTRRTRPCRMGLPMAPSVLLQLVGPKVASHVRHSCTTRGPSASRSKASRASPKARMWSSSTHRARSTRSTAVLEALADESRRILEDGVVAEAADIDTCLLLGAGFPFWLGGITKHLDQTGVSERVVGRPLAAIGARS